jgi:hypothetical protein
MYVSLVTNKGWALYESQHLRGRPATHAVEFGTGRTVCGRDCSYGWSRPYADLRLVNCRICKPRLEKILGCKVEELDKGVEITCG